jgi:DNA-binding protein HU-beta
MAKSKRTVLRSSAGKKLYAVRDAGGKFKDIQSYARAHAADIKRGTTTAEATAKVARKKGKTAKKAAAKKAPAKKK